MMKEIRNYNDNITFRNENDSRHVEGYAVLFNSYSKLINNQFIEIVERNALDGVIEKSDVLCVLNHNQDKGVLARSKRGVGSLTLTVDDKGLKYSFDAPHTALGDELIESLKRGDITSSSFAFTVKDDYFEQRSDGQVIRHINSFNQLFDVSPVYFEAYPGTSVDMRSYNEFMERMEQEKETIEEVRNDSEKDEEMKESENQDDDVKDEPSNDESEKEDEPKDEEREEEEKPSDDSNDDDDESEKDETRNDNDNLYNKLDNTHNIMNKKEFSLINTINDTINRRSNEFVNGNTISLPLEMRAEGDGADAPAVPNGILAGVETQGKEVIPNQLWDVIADLKDKMVLSELGANFIHSNSTIELPRYSGEQASWVGEVADAKDVAGKFSSIKIVPLRLSAYCDVSNTWLEMNSANAEAVLRNEIVNCLAEKLQKTILGNGKGSDVEPQGLFYNVTADTADFTYADAVAMEEQLESANVYSDIKYCANPSAKSKLRVQPIDKGSGKFVFESNEILGIPALSTNSVVTKGLILGDWSQLYVATFGNVRLTVDSLTKAISNQTRIVITMDCNYAVRREEAFVKRILK